MSTQFFNHESMIKHADVSGGLHATQWSGPKVQANCLHIGITHAKMCLDVRLEVSKSGALNGIYLQCNPCIIVDLKPVYQQFTNFLGHPSAD